MIGIAIKIAAITQRAAIHRPPKRIHRRLSKKEKADMAFLRDLGTMGLSWALSRRFGTAQNWILRCPSPSFQFRRHGRINVRCSIVMNSPKSHGRGTS
jgi:hypothetical protein